MPDPFLYFAYGSNLHLPRMLSRCPGAEMLFIARRDGYQFRMTRKRSNGFGAADIVPAEGSCVYGVVYLIPQSQRGDLRKAEGWRENRGAYLEQKDFDVVNTATGETARTVTYTVRQPHQPPVPTTRRYRDFVLNGARYWQLPLEYIDQLQAAIAVTDCHER